MINVSNAEYMNLKPVSNKEYFELISPLFAPNEHIIMSFQADKLGGVFTNKRIFGVNLQNEASIDITSLPYRKIQAFSVSKERHSEKAGLELWISGDIKIKLDFVSNVKIDEICAIISTLSLS